MVISPARTKLQPALFEPLCVFRKESPLGKTLAGTINKRVVKVIAAALPSIPRASFGVPGVAAPSTAVPAAHSLLFSFRLSLDNTEAELHSLFVRTKSLKENIQRDRELCQQMEDFLQVSDSSQPLISSSVAL